LSTPIATLIFRRLRVMSKHCETAEAGVQAIIVPAIEAANFERVLNLAQHHRAIYAALGLHPMIERHLDEHIEKLDVVLQTAGNKLVAIGEIGLDLWRDDPAFERQQALLDAQLRLAKRHDLPVILHSRRTRQTGNASETYRSAANGRCAWFSGSLQQAAVY
jgi:TatD DNase family protein